MSSRDDVSPTDQNPSTFALADSDQSLPWKWSESGRLAVQDASVGGSWGFGRGQAQVATALRVVDDGAKRVTFARAANLRKIVEMFYSTIIYCIRIKQKNAWTYDQNFDLKYMYIQYLSSSSTVVFKVLQYSNCFRLSFKHHSVSVLYEN